MATSDATGSPAVFGSLSEPTAFTAESGLTIDWSSSSGGRVARPSSRRRPRISRRAPVTMLNTDTANFRALVQQFTGVPSDPYSSGYQRGGGPVVTFGRSSSDPVRETVSVFPVQHYQPPQQQQQRYQYSETAFGAGSNYGHAFLQELTTNSAMSSETVDGFLFEGLSSQRTARPTSANSRLDGYFF
ncbi:hypothetical protein BHM03_00011918 [Ensete ventricosum]|nr:hypothetical protein BHM03_00011918 [Ensete ventricosum]